MHSVPVLNQSVASDPRATLARGSPFAVMAGSLNFPGSSWVVGANAVSDMTWSLNMHAAGTVARSAMLADFVRFRDGNLLTITSTRPNVKPPIRSVA